MYLTSSPEHVALNYQQNFYTKVQSKNIVPIASIANRHKPIKKCSVVHLELANHLVSFASITTILWPPFSPNAGSHRHVTAVSIVVIPVIFSVVKAVS